MAALLSLPAFPGHRALLTDTHLVAARLVFAVSHPRIWGLYSILLRTTEAVEALLFVGLILGMAYQRTGSLRWCVVGHMSATVVGLAALVLLNHR